MSTKVLPAIPGIGFPWTRTPMFKTRKQENISGKEVRLADWSTPRYKWELVVNFLRQGTILGTYTEFATLEGFFEGLLGGWDSWLYQDADDNTITGQVLGIGNNSNKNFSLIRAFGGNNVLILAPNLTGMVNVYDNSVVQNPSTYTITPWGSTDPLGPGVVKFNNAPASGHTISIDYSWYFPVRFDDDTMTFNKFMSNLYEVKKMSFTSIK